MNPGRYRSLKRLEIIGVCDGAWVERRHRLDAMQTPRLIPLLCSLFPFSFLVVETCLYRRGPDGREGKDGSSRELKGGNSYLLPSFFFGLDGFKFDPLSFFMSTLIFTCL